MSALLGLPSKESFAAGPIPQETVAFQMPRGACDAHVHVIGDHTQFPMSQDRDYTPPTATAEELRDVLQRLRLNRAVIVTPTIYGTDNAVTVAAIAKLGRDRARGVALVDHATPPDVLDAIRDAGITGIRLLLGGGRDFDRSAATSRLRFAIECAEGRRWHLQISAAPYVTNALAAELISSPVPLVFDFFGWLGGGWRQLGFNTVLSLLESGQAYVKLTEPYRVSKEPPDYANLIPLVRAFLAANTERLLWGSGWPHVDSTPVPYRAKTDIAPNLPVDAGHLLNLLAKWTPDAKALRKILVENPARLYGF